MERGKLNIERRAVLVALSFLERDLAMAACLSLSVTNAGNASKLMNY